MFVLDCSVTMSWLFQDERTTYTEKLLEYLQEQETAIAPSLWPAEVANVLLVAERKKRISSAQSLQFLAVLKALPIEIEEPPNLQTIQALLLLAQTYRLTAYDACYLELAIRHSSPLASLDKNLLKAAKECGIPFIK
ncbi:MAG: type II toxin-antitoxin system VapC family toxin [Gammaproteobacteria bacterium]